MTGTKAKSKLILEAVRGLLISDNTDTGNDMREIYHYTSHRIIRSHIPVGNDFPQIIMKLDENDAMQLLPSGEFNLVISCWELLKKDAAHEVVDDMAARVIYLLHNKVDDLNNQVSGESLRLRLITKQSNLENTDEILKAVFRTVIFRIVADDEVLEC